MNQLSKLTLLMATFMVISCNEQVSPELKNANSSTTNPNPTEPDEFSFRVTNSALPILNYKIHKTGAGNKDSLCEVKNTQFSADRFRSAQSTYDITCFYEAEELSILHSGLNFKVEASPGTCAFVGYSPYSYYNNIPGDSTATVIKSICDDNVNSGDLPGTEPACDSYRDNGLPGTSFQVTSDDKLCRFNHSTTQKCDIGVVTVLEKTWSWDLGLDGVLGGGDDTLESQTATKSVDCGGSIVSCVSGPVKLESTTTTRITKIAVADENTGYSKSYNLPGLIDKNLGSNKSYVNFRRNLASKTIDYGHQVNNYTDYREAFGDSTTGINTFNPDIMELYSYNSRMDLVNDLVTTPMRNTALIHNIPGDTYRAKPLAADPFIGLDGNAVSPFYTFNCYNSAFELKSRIRMVVREWDRMISTDIMLERISDISQIYDLHDTKPHQDVPDTLEVDIDPSGDFNGAFLYNDLNDWDDDIAMDRTLGPYNRNLTIWRPVPTALYPNGFFNPSIFPNETPLTP